MAALFSLDSALQKLKQVAKECNQKDVVESIDSLAATEETLRDKSKIDTIRLATLQKQIHNFDSVYETRGAGDSKWAPFKLSLKNQNQPKLRECALDLLQKLVSTGEVIGCAFVQAEVEEGADTPSEKPLIDEILHCVCTSTPLNSFNVPVSSEEGVHLQIIKVLLTCVTSGWVEVHSDTLLMAVQAIINVYLYTRSNVNSVTSKAAITQVVHHIFSQYSQFYESFEKFKGAVANDTSELSNKYYEMSDDEYLKVLQNDCVSVMKLFAKLAVRLDGGNAAQQPQPKKDANETALEDLSPLMIKLRALSLEMILMIMTNTPSRLIAQDPFLPLLKTQVTMALLKNGLQTHVALFEFALSNFLILLKSFKEHLKYELEVLFNEVYLYVLDNQLCSVRYKLLVLQGLLSSLCMNGKDCVDLYVNYDCDMNMVSLYEKIVSLLAKLAQGNGLKIPSSVSTTTVTSPGEKPGTSPTTVGVFGLKPDATNDKSVLQERKLRVRSLKCLVGIEHSLVEWMKEISNKPGISVLSRESQESAQSETETAVSNPLSAQSVVMVNKNPLQAIAAMGSSRPSFSHSESEFNSPSISPSHDLPEEFEKIKNKKSLLKQGISRFNESPNKGIEFLRENGFLNNPKSVAKFLRDQTDLRKQSVGDYIGEGKDFNIIVMHEFVDSFEFKKVGFVAALRQFLQAFRLPGEAQKIDRILEKFAARYCDNNPDVFAKADTAYVLAFSIMMLNTDQHSSSVKNRMTKQDFIKNNRGINDNADLPDEFLSAIYDDIQINEIVLEEERTVKELEKMTKVGLTSQSAVSSGTVYSRESNELKRREMYKRETKHVEKKSQNLIKKGKDKDMVPWRSAFHVDHARPMFEILVWPLMAVLSTIFEECLADEYPVALLGGVSESEKAVSVMSLTGEQSNEEVIDMCLHGFDLAIKISSTFGMETERDAFVSSLSRLTGMNDLVGMKPKNLAALKMLFLVANNIGNQLNESWKYVFKVVSDMDKWQLISAEQTSPQVTNAAVESPIARRNSLSRLINVAFLENNQSVILAIDKIFENSVKLDGNSIVHFYRCACLVSEEEIQANRLYMLQRIVEITYYNMSSRIKLEWSHIWKILTSYFNLVGSSDNVQIASTAVDSLRQLGMKFLDKSELSHFHQNNEFMKPFEHIMRSTKHFAIKELIIQSIDQMVVARAKNIRSGWKSVFLILSRLGQGPSSSFDPKSLADLVGKSLKVVRLVLETYWSAIQEYFVDYSSCLIDIILYSDKLLAPSATSNTPADQGYLLNESVDKCFTLLREASNKLAVDATITKSHKLDNDSFYLHWFPLLSGLSKLQRDAKVVLIRQKALDSFFEILKLQGSKFSFKNNHWRTIVKSVIMPVFEDLRMNAVELTTSNNSIFIHCIKRMIEVYTQYFVPSSSNDDNSECFMANLDLLKDLFSLILLLLSRNSDNLCHTGILYLHLIIKQNYKKFDGPCWILVSDVIDQVFQTTIPIELLRFTGNKHGSVESGTEIEQQLDVDHAILKCGVHLFVLQLVRDLCLEYEDEAQMILSGNSLPISSPTSGIKGNISTSSIASSVLLASNNEEESKEKCFVSQFPSDFLIRMPPQCRNRLLSCLHASFVFSNAFNSNYELRLLLLRSNVVQQMPNLIKQETQSIGTYLSLLFHLYRHEGDIQHDELQEDGQDILANSALVYKRNNQDILKCLVEESTNVIHRYSDFLVDAAKNNRDIVAWSSIIRLIWKEINSIRWQEESSDKSYKDFKKTIPAFFKLAVKLISSDRPDIRSVLQDFLNRIANYLENAMQ